MVEPLDAYAVYSHTLSGLAGPATSSPAVAGQHPSLPSVNKGQIEVPTSLTKITIHTALQPLIPQWCLTIPKFNHMLIISSSLYARLKSFVVPTANSPTAPLNLSTAAGVCVEGSELTVKQENMFRGEARLASCQGSSHPITVVRSQLHLKLLKLTYIVYVALCERRERKI